MAAAAEEELALLGEDPADEVDDAEDAGAVDEAGELAALPAPPSSDPPDSLDPPESWEPPRSLPLVPLYDVLPDGAEPDPPPAACDEAGGDAFVPGVLAPVGDSAGTPPVVAWTDGSV